MKLTETCQLRSTLEEDTLDQTLRLCIEGPLTLSDEDIDLVFLKLETVETKTIIYTCLYECECLAVN